MVVRWSKSNSEGRQGVIMGNVGWGFTEDSMRFILADDFRSYDLA